MRRFLVPFLALATLATIAAPAQAAFGVKDFDLRFTNADGSVATQAGSHPFAVTNVLHFNTTMDPIHGEVPDEAAKDIDVQLPAGLVGSPTATPRCSGADFIVINQNSKIPGCSNSTAVGTISLELRAFAGREFLSAPVYNLIPPPGVIQKLGFSAFGVPIAIEFTVSPDPPYNVVVSPRNIAQPLPIFGSRLTVWGNPGNPAHDAERGSCVEAGVIEPSYHGIFTTGASCPANIVEKPFVTLPRSCTGPLVTQYRADSWQNPGIFTSGSALTHDDSEPPLPQGMTGCSKLGFSPTISAQPTTKASQSPTGLDFGLEVSDEGLSSPSGLAYSDIKRTVVTLPEGFSTNPALAEGLGACSEADLARESVGSVPGAGCPNSSKIGTVEVETPLLEESLDGAVYVATPYENKVGSLIALYVVIKNPNLGVVVKQALEVQTNPATGQLTTVADDMPQLPFSRFRLRFREGARSPLVTPPGCDTYSVNAQLIPNAGGPPINTSSSFQITSGPSGGGCPSGGQLPFHPDLVAGTLSNSAGRYSPYYLRLSRNDSEQEMTRFAIKLPPGVVGKLAGIPFCSDAAIAAAKARTGPHGGQEEIEHPSCPGVSEVGHTLAGAGVGPALTYAPGKVYLAGPYRGAHLSIAAITAAKVGPFDLGTVVVREALRIDQETAEVMIDPNGSDPFPHILQGIPVHLRDIRAYVDRPEFILNPTNCTRTATAATVFGSGLDFGSDADNPSFVATAPFQAADCADLAFKPKLALSLDGGTKRGDNPSFKAVLTARRGDANIGRAQVTLPHSEFLDQTHIKTICTRVQFNQGTVPGEKCPGASIYGFAKATTPLLDEPVQGPVYLRSSSHNLPDLVAALHSTKIDIALVGRIDSVKGGRIRNTFDVVPDAPVTKFTLTMQGGKKGLLVNSSNLCGATNRAIADFTGQNGRRQVFKPAVTAKSCKAKKSSKRRTSAMP
jgi:hypothetical protein